MIHLRVIVPPDLVETIVEELPLKPGVAHLVRLPSAALVPPGDVLLCDVSREGANEVVEWLQDNGVHRRGAIVIESAEAVVSDAAAAAESELSVDGADALIWEQVEARAREDSTLTVSYLIFMTIAAVIAVAAILLDSPVLMVGAMVVGPDYGPIAAACVSLVRRRLEPSTRALLALAAGLSTGVGAALVATSLLRLIGVAGDNYTVTKHELSAAISNPDALAVLVALLAGVAGMLALTESRSGVLVGVFVSVTTVPAIANIGVAAAYGQWGRMGGSSLQLAVNVAGLLLAGVITLWVQDRFTARRTARRRRQPVAYGT